MTTKENPRNNARVILLDEKKRVLLLFADDPIRQFPDGSKHPPFWFPPGGGMEKEETIKEAAIRELFEETGIAESDISIGPIIWREDSSFIRGGKESFMRNNFVLAHSKKTDICFSGFTDQEKDLIKDAKWFSLDEMEKSSALFYPKDLMKHIGALLNKPSHEFPILINP